jgi:hypothetical protein
VFKPNIFAILPLRKIAFIFHKFDNICSRHKYYSLFKCYAKNKFFLLKLMVFGFIGYANAQFSEAIREAAQMYAQANLNEDYELLLDFTYPSVIEHAGGREAYKKLLIQLNEIQKNRGMRLNEFIIKDPLDHVKAGNEFHAIVPYRTVSKVKGGPSDCRKYAYSSSS